VIEAAALFGFAPVSGTSATVGVAGFAFGGGATSLEVRLHPVSEVFGGTARFDRGLAPHLPALFREYAMPEALNVSIVVSPDAVALRGVYAGGADDAWRALAPRFVAEPFEDTFRAMSYAETAAAVEVKRWGGPIARGATPAGHATSPSR
jgi:hypothetical protein